MLTQMETDLVHRLNEIKLDNVSLDCIALILIQCCSLIIQGFTITKEECDKLIRYSQKYE